MKKKAGTSKSSAAEKEHLWVEAMLTNGGHMGNAGWAAGSGTQKGADQFSQRMRQKPHVMALLEKRRAEVLAAAQEKTQLKADGALRELRDIVHSDLRKVFDQKTGALLPPHLWPDDVARAMASVKVVEMAGGMKIDGADGVSHVPMYTKEVKLWDKNSAIEKAMKHFGLFKKDNEQQPPAVVLRSTRVAPFQPYKGRVAQAKP